MSSHQPDLFSTDPDHHIVETPEQIDLHFQVAGIGSRFLAIAIDTLIQGGTGLILAIVLPIVFLETGMARWLPSSTLWISAFLIVFFFLLYFGYFAAFEILWNGQTPGKRITGLRVLKDSGRPLHALEVLGRNLLRIVDQLPGFYGVGIIVALLNRSGKRLGDLVAGSIVVRDSSSAHSAPSWTTAGTAEALPSLLGAARLTAEEAGLIERFLSRRNDLSPEVRDRMAREIIKRLEPKVEVLGRLEGEPENTLIRLLREYRSGGG